MTHFAALEHMGAAIIDSLEVSFNKTGIDQTTQLRIIELLGEMRLKKGRCIAAKKISHPHRVAVCGH